MALLQAYQSRGIAYNIVIRDIAGTVITPQSGDIVRVRVHACGTDYLTVSSSEATTHGSSIVTGETNQLKINADDLTGIEPGIYSLSIDYYDSADSQWKEVEKNCLNLEAP